MKKVSEYITKAYGKGILNVLDESLIDDGAASYSRNFITLLDRIELVEGRRVIGTEDSGNVGCLGIATIAKADGTEVVFRKVNTSLQYLDPTTGDWEDSLTGLLPNEPMYFAQSATPAGKQLWACGQDGLYKIYPSAPADPINLTDETKNYKGYIIIEKSRMVCVGMKDDPTGIRFSRVDKDSNYVSVIGESVGVLGSTTYTGTLANDQVFGLLFSDGTLNVRDDKNGNLIGDGTGTINYATGAYSVTFSAATTGAVVVDYLHEDPLNEGLADFTTSASRLAGEGNVLRQDSTGSKSQAVFTFNNTFYTLQERGAWQVTISADDKDWDNQVYRANIGCPSPRAAVVTADGIIFVDTYDKENPKLRLLTFNQLGDKIVPISLSDNFKMDEYTFDEETALFKKGDFVLISCKKDSASNNVILMYNISQKSFDTIDYTGNCFTDYLNKILAGDSLSPNVYELFTGKDDLNYTVNAEWVGNKKNLRTDYLKKYKRFRMTGLIDLEQSFLIQQSYDNEPYVTIGEIRGDGKYVDYTDVSLLGAPLVGEDLIGLSDSSEAMYFEAEVKVRTPKFKRVKTRFVPTGIGYLAIMEQKFHDVRLKSAKIPKKYKTGTGQGIGSMSITDTFTVN